MVRSSGHRFLSSLRSLRAGSRRCGRRWFLRQGSGETAPAGKAMPPYWPVSAHWGELTSRSAPRAQSPRPSLTYTDMSNGSSPRASGFSLAPLGVIPDGLPAAAAAKIALGQPIAIGRHMQMRTGSQEYSGMSRTALTALAFVCIGVSTHAQDFSAEDLVNRNMHRRAVEA